MNNRRCIAYQLDRHRGTSKYDDKDDDKLNLCDDTIWGSDKYDTEIAFDVDSENNFDD